MAEVRKRFLMLIAGIVVRKNMEVKKCCGIDEGRISVDCKDDFVQK